MSQGIRISRKSVHDSIREWVLDPGQYSMPSAPSLVIFTFFTSMISFPPSSSPFFPNFADDLLSHSRLSSHDLLFCRLRVSFRWFIWSPSSTVIESVQPAILSFCVALSLSFSRMISIPDFIFVIPVRDLGGRDEEKRKQTDWNNLILIMVRKREEREEQKEEKKRMTPENEGWEIKGKRKGENRTEDRIFSLDFLLSFLGFPGSSCSSSSSRFFSLVLFSLESFSPSHFFIFFSIPTPPVILWASIQLDKWY